MRYPAVGEIWSNESDWEFECFFVDDKGFGLTRLSDGYRFIVDKEVWEGRVEYWYGPKTVCDVLCFYVTSANTIKATYYGNKDATGKPYFLKLMSDGELRVDEA